MREKRKRGREEERVRMTRGREERQNDTRRRDRMTQGEDIEGSVPPGKLYHRAPLMMPPLRMKDAPHLEYTIYGSCNKGVI